MADKKTKAKDKTKVGEKPGPQPTPLKYLKFLDKCLTDTKFRMALFNAQNDNQAVLDLLSDAGIGEDVEERNGLLKSILTVKWDTIYSMEMALDRAADIEQIAGKLHTLDG